MFDKLIDVALKFIELFQFWFICRAYEQGLVLRWGKFNRLVLPGFHWRWPFRVEVEILVNVVSETITVGPQSLTTTDEQPVVVSTVVTLRIDDVRKFLLETEGAHQVVEDMTFGIVADFVLCKTWAELRACDMANELTKKARARCKRYGVEVINVQIGDLTRSRSIRLIAPLGHRSRIAA